MRNLLLNSILKAITLRINKLSVFFTLKQTHSEKGRVTTTRPQDIAVNNHPHNPIPLSLSSAKKQYFFPNYKNSIEPSEIYIHIYI